MSFHVPGRRLAICSNVLAMSACISATTSGLPSVRARTSESAIERATGASGFEALAGATSPRPSASARAQPSGGTTKEWARLPQFRRSSTERAPACGRDVAPRTGRPTGHLRKSPGPRQDAFPRCRAAPRRDRPVVRDWRDSPAEWRDNPVSRRPGSVAPPARLSAPTGRPGPSRPWRRAGPAPATLPRPRHTRWDRARCQPRGVERRRSSGHCHRII